MRIRPLSIHGAEWGDSNVRPEMPVYQQIKKYMLQIICHNLQPVRNHLQRFAKSFECFKEIP